MFQVNVAPKKLAVVVTAVDAAPLAKESIKWLVKNTSKCSDIFLLDNGSASPLGNYGQDLTIRFDENIGGNATFHETAEYFMSCGYEYVAHLHCDLMVQERDWDLRVIDAFEADPKLAILGFVGSNELDAGGGRGLGTVLNFQGIHYPDFGTATPAEPHGERLTGFRPAAVLDHCSMIFRLEHLVTLPPQRGNFAPGHFYDRILCCEAYLHNYRVGYLGIACDHFSGGTAGGAASREEMYRKWLAEEGIVSEDGNLDRTVYLESERRFLTRYRDSLGFVPFKVQSDYSLVHPQWR